MKVVVSAFVILLVAGIMTAGTASSSSLEPTPVPTPSTHSPWGDVDCDDLITSIDALAVLRHVAALPPISEPPCAGVGSPSKLGAVQFGDVDCDAVISSVDALRILRYVAGMYPGFTPPGCAPVGAPVGD